MSEVDHYAVLGLPSGEQSSSLSFNEIRKAYRSKALKVHPDKCPDDPNAAAAFLNIQSSYEILSDPAARKAFDDLIRLRHEQEQRRNRVDSKRRKMIDELNQKEKAWDDLRGETDQRSGDIERAKKKIEEEIERIMKMKAEAKAKAKEGVKTGEVEDREKERIVEVSWRETKELDAKKLREVFGKFGEVEYVVMKKKTARKALVVMASRKDVVAVAQSNSADFSGLHVRPLCAIDRDSSSHSQQQREPMKCFGDGFEDSILEKLAKAAEQQKADALKQESSLAHPPL